MQQGFELQTVFPGDHDLAVHHGLVRQLTAKGIDEFGEIARQGTFVAATELELITVTKNYAAKAVPLRFVEIVGAGGELPSQFGQHG